ncbi:MAG: SAF domain-containing protein [Acidimicrobiia bacterium]
MLALLGMWVFAALYLSAGSRVEVLVAARDISPYEALEQGDLRVERVAADPGVASIDAGAVEEVVGRAAATQIPEGTLLSPAHLYESGERLVSATEAAVGVEVSPGKAPGAGLEPGAELVVVVQPPQGLGGEAQEVPGWVYDVGEIDSQTGEREVTVVVPRSSASQVGGASADGRVALTVIGGG